MCATIAVALLGSLSAFAQTLDAEAPKLGSGWTAGKGQNVTQTGTFTITNTGSSSMTLKFSGRMSTTRTSNPIAATAKVTSATVKSDGYAEKNGNTLTVGPGVSVSATVETSASIKVDSSGAITVHGSQEAETTGGTWVAEGSATSSGNVVPPEKKAPPEETN